MSNIHYRVLAYLILVISMTVNASTISMVVPSAFSESIQNKDKAEHSLRFIGRAYDPQSGKLFYTEHHEIQLNENGQYKDGNVTYLDAHGKLFAEKYLSYGEQKTLPDTHFRELNSPLKFSTQNTKQGIQLTFQDEQENSSSTVQLESDGYHVIDAGFDRLVNVNWSDLQQGQALNFSFLAVTRAAFYDFRLVKTQQSNDDQLVLKLEPDNILFRWLLDPAYLTYNMQTRKLMRFEGLTNIRKQSDNQTQDEHYVAVIEYDYL